MHAVKIPKSWPIPNSNLVKIEYPLFSMPNRLFSQHISVELLATTFVKCCFSPSHEPKSVHLANVYELQSSSCFLSKWLHKLSWLLSGVSHLQDIRLLSILRKNFFFPGLLLQSTLNLKFRCRLCYKNFYR